MSSSRAKLDDFRAVALSAALAPGDHRFLNHLNAIVSHGSVQGLCQPPGHGLCVELSAKANGQFVPPADELSGCTLDIHGPGLFAALPNGLGSMAQLLLPLDVIMTTGRLRVTPIVTPTERRRGIPTENETWRGSIVLGAKKLSRGRIESTLADIVAAGDPPFLFELRSSKGLLGWLPTRASLILQGLKENNTPILDEGELATFTVNPLRLVTGWLRWWFCPLLFLGASWLLFLRPELLLPLAPLLLSVDEGRTAVASVLPPHPLDMATAFRLGGVHARLEALLAAGVEATHATVAALLNEATEVLAAGSRGAATASVDSAEALGNMLLEIERFEAQIGVVRRVYGFFSFVNTVWLFAILGIAVSIGPSVYHLLRPLHEALRRLLRYLCDEFLIPLARAFEAAGWALCWLGRCAATRRAA